MITQYENILALIAFVNCFGKNFDEIYLRKLWTETFHLSYLKDCLHWISENWIHMRCRVFLQYDEFNSRSIQNIG